MRYTDFYSAASQIIPVLFVASLVERIWVTAGHRHDRSPTDQLFALGILVVAEMGALFGLATHTSAPSVAALVGFAIVVAAWTLLWPIIKPLHGAARARAGSERLPRWFDLLTLYFVLVFSVGSLVASGALLLLRASIPH